MTIVQSDEESQGAPLPRGARGAGRGVWVRGRGLGAGSGSGSGSESRSADQIQTAGNCDCLSAIDRIEFHVEVSQMRANGVLRYQKALADLGVR